MSFVRARRHIPAHPSPVPARKLKKGLVRDYKTVTFLERKLTSDEERGVLCAPI